MAKRSRSISVLLIAFALSTATPAVAGCIRDVGRWITRALTPKPKATAAQEAEIQRVLRTIPRPVLARSGKPVSEVHPRAVKAVEGVLRARLLEGRTIPDGLEMEAPPSAFTRQWKAESEARYADIPAYGTREAPIPLSRVAEGQRTLVFRAIIDGEPRYFRPAGASHSGSGDQYSIVRRRAAISRLAALLGAKTVPRGGLARVNGVLGSLDAEAPGQAGIHVPASRLDPRSVADAQGFEFLVANSDVTRFNYNVEPGPEGGQVQVFDHDNAFMIWLPRANGTLLEGALPERYTRSFIDRLRAASPERIRSGLEDVLAPREIEALLLRREIILRDADTRGLYFPLP